MTEQVQDSSSGWVREHAQRYEDSGGTEGTDWEGTPCLLLTVRGRSSGQLRRTALICGQDGDDFIVVGSRGGRPEHPNWYLNLVEHPEVVVRFKTEVFRAHAVTVSGDERARLWDYMAGFFPKYTEYQAMTERSIPVVRLIRQEDIDPGAIADVL